MIVRSRSERAQAVARAAPDPADRYTALGWLKSATGPQGATAVFRRALEADPEARSARFGLTSALRERIEAEDPEALAIAGPLDGVEGAVVAGWRHAARGDWKQVRALEPALAAARPLDPGEREAMRLRIQWRLESDDPAARAEAVELWLGSSSSRTGPATSSCARGPSHVPIGPGTRSRCSNSSPRCDDAARGTRGGQRWRCSTRCGPISSPRGGRACASSCSRRDEDAGWLSPGDPPDRFRVAEQRDALDSGIRRPDGKLRPSGRAFCRTRLRRCYWSRRRSA